VTVHRAPTVAILATGDELRTSERYDDVRRGAAIPESNAPMLAAMARTAGALALPLGIAADDPADLRDRIGAAAHAEVLVTVGGASMGEADLVKRVLDELGFTLDFWRVRMRPGSPVSFGWLARGDRRQPVFGLPGNPASAFVTFEVFVRPFLRALAGHRRVLRPVVSCACGERMTAAVGLTHFLRVTLGGSDGRTSVRLAGPQGSGLVSSLARADGLAIVPEDVERLEVGESVAVMLLDPGAAG
jgi:molybdopterin molybdotransferase